MPIRVDLVGVLINVVLDNLNTHIDTKKGRFITEWNKNYGKRFVFHHTPPRG